MELNSSKHKSPSSRTTSKDSNDQSEDERQQGRAMSHVLDASSQKRPSAHFVAHKKAATQRVDARQRSTTADEVDDDDNDGADEDDDDNDMKISTTT